MDDHIPEVQEHPPRLRGTLPPQERYSFLGEGLVDLFENSLYLTLAAATAYNEVISEVALPPQVQHQNIAGQLVRGGLNRFVGNLCGFGYFFLDLLDFLPSL